MWYKGAPHVSFYLFEKGEGFGGNYVGEGRFSAEAVVRV
jgi:hypothetical protein